jgi:ribonucleoside-diphosphate reductase alpha chain
VARADRPKDTGARVRLDAAADVPLQGQGGNGHGHKEQREDPVRDSVTRHRLESSKELETDPSHLAGPKPRVDTAASTTVITTAMNQMQADAPACDVCGTITVRSGTCYKCLNCGNSMGCS